LQKSKHLGWYSDLPNPDIPSENKKGKSPTPYFEILKGKSGKIGIQLISFLIRAIRKIRIAEAFSCLVPARPGWG
jgi:hypothetical protein